MKRLISILAVAFLCCNLSSLAFGQRIGIAEGGYAVRALGAQNCGKFVEIVSRKENQSDIILYAQWISGYVTAFNVEKKIHDSFPIRAPLDELFRFVVAVCSGNNQGNLVAVLAASLNALKPLHVTKQSVHEKVKIQGSEFEFYKSYIKASQSFLRENGYRVSVDGKLGELSKKAFKKFKEDEGLKGPPVPDFIFLLHLLAKKK